VTPATDHRKYIARETAIGAAINGLLSEGAFWSASTYVAGPNTSAATGVMNTGGNAAGFLAPVVGLMVDHLGWLATLASGSVFAVIGAALWLLIRIRRPVACQ